MSRPFEEYKPQTVGEASAASVPYEPKDQMVAVSLQFLERDRPSSVDLFLPIIKDGKLAEMKHFCSSGEIISEEYWSLFDKVKLKSVCVRASDIDKFIDDVRARSDRLFASSAIPPEQKVKMFKEMTSLSVRLAFNSIGNTKHQVVAAVNLAVGAIHNFLRDADVLNSMVNMLAASRSIYDHSVNVCMMSLVMARRQNLDKERLLSVGMGALLHDVGLTRVPEEVLSKPEPLNEEEWGMIRKHPLWGRQILSQSPTMPYDALKIVLMHHERPDGSGYPSGLTGGNIPYFARLVRIVDKYDSLTSPQPYRPAVSPSEAMAQLLEDYTDNVSRGILKQFLTVHREIVV